MKLNVAKRWVVGVLAIMMGAASAESFNSRSLRIEIENVDGMVINDFNGNSSPDILLIGRDNNRQKQLQIVTLDSGKAAKQQTGVVSLSDEVLFYDTAKLSGQEKQALLFLTTKGISRYDIKSKQLEPLIRAESLYRDAIIRTSAVNRMQLAYDVNNDELSDIVVQNFNQATIYIQQQDGRFAPPQIIDMSAQLRIFRDNTAAFNPSPMFLADFNFDGQSDIIFRVKSNLHVFLQKNGVFERTAQVYPLVLNAALDDLADGFETDHSNSKTHTFFRMQDLNNDGVLDLMTKLTKSSGLFDKSSQYQIYLGAKNERGVTGFPQSPNSVIASKGLQFELQMVDMNGDDKLDFISPSYELGIGAIIGSLFSSSADLDISFYAAKDNGNYGPKPNLEKELTVDFNLTSGAQVYPLMKVDDFNGDGVDDLLLGNGSKRVYLYYGNQSDKLFERSKEKFKVKLPRDGRLVYSKDLNNDGKTDLVIRYGKLDGKSLNKEMKILLAD